MIWCPCVVFCTPTNVAALLTCLAKYLMGVWSVVCLPPSLSPHLSQPPQQQIWRIFSFPSPGARMDCHSLVLLYCNSRSIFIDFWCCYYFHFQPRFYLHFDVLCLSGWAWVAFTPGMIDKWRRFSISKLDKQWEQRKTSFKKYFFVLNKPNSPNQHRKMLEWIK